MSGYTANTWNVGDKISKTKLDRLEQGVAEATAMTVSAVKTAAYTAAAYEIVPVDASTAGVAITLPTAPADKTRVTIKKIDSSTNAVTVARGGSTDVFNKASGSTSITLALANQTATFQYAASTAIWYLVASDLPLSQLDGRYTGGAAESILSTALGQFELQPMVAYGHSWVELDTNATAGTRWYQRLVSRLRMTTATNRGLSGRTIGDVATAALASTYKWTSRSRVLVGAVCTINDVTLFRGTAAARVGYQHAWRSLLSLFASNAVVAANTTSFTYSSGWSAEAVTYATTQAASTAASGGTRFRTTTVGATFSFTYTESGTGVDVVLVARAAGAGLVTFTEGSTTLGTLDLTPATAQDTPAVFKLRGLSVGTHTIVGTLTSGASATVDSYRIPSSAPVPMLILGEPPVVPAAGDIAGYVAEVETLKGYLATICAEYPTATYVNLSTALSGSWNTATMLTIDGKHPNDQGCAFVAAASAKALAGTAYQLGLNVTGTAYPATYTAPTGPSIPSGGQDGTGAGAGQTGPTVQYSDSFTRADSVTTLGSTDGGAQPATAWSILTAASGVWGITSNRAKAQSGGLAIANLETSHADLTLEGTLGALNPTSANRICSIAFRVQDLTNFWQAGTNNNGTAAYCLVKKVGGTNTTVATTTTTPVVGDVVKVVLSGSTITLFVNGAQVAQVTDTALQTATKHGMAGLFTTDPTSSWSAFKVSY
jgi:hypothetical protein